MIETPRASIRYLSDDDAEPLACLVADAESMRYVGNGRPLAPEDARRWIAVSRGNYDDHGYDTFAVVDKASGAFAGYAGFVRSADVVPPEEAELIYALLPDYRGRGLASEVAAALIAHGFAVFGLRRILATIDPANAPSLRIVEKLGFILRETKPDEFGLETHFFWTERPE
jgi:[ribosomal protein S5]-alanine N-acetyltransferase